MTKAQRSAIKIGLHIMAVLVAIRLISDFMETNNEGRYQALARRFAALLVHTKEIKADAESKNLFIGYSDWHFFWIPSSMMKN
jgi:hypothetical protein